MSYTITSTVTYGAESWKLKSKISKLNSTEMDFWRRSARISRRDRIKSSAIIENMNVQNSITDLIKKWYGHVKRMTEVRFLKKKKKMEATW